MEYSAYPNGRCQSCGRAYRENSEWCQPCYQQRFQKEFHSWTSGHALIDSFIKDTQLNADNPNGFLQFIPFEKFREIKPIGEGGFATIYSAKCFDGQKIIWDPLHDLWSTWDETLIVLKLHRNSGRIIDDFLREMQAQVQCSGHDSIQQYIGFTRQPHTNQFFLIMKYADVNLRQFIRNNYQKLSLAQIFNILNKIADGLAYIHLNGFVHRNLHPGNILQSHEVRLWQISDIGLIGPVDQRPGSRVIGILPYLAPEVLRRSDYTSASDIYSLGMIMYEMTHGHQPFYDRAHDNELTEKICKGLRPSIHKNIPRKIVELLNLCWHENPQQRPSADQCQNFFSCWTNHKKFLSYNESNLTIYPPPHPQAIYTSRYLGFAEISDLNNDENRNLKTPNQNKKLSESLGNGTLIDHSLQLSFSGDNTIDGLIFNPKSAAKESKYLAWDFGQCQKCGGKFKEERWCQYCTRTFLQDEFDKWTSGNKMLDQFIQNIQKSATSANQLIEWVPFEKFTDIVIIGNGNAGPVFSGKYFEGFKVGWNASSCIWDKFYEPDGKFVLKSIPNSKQITEELLKEITNGITCITPETINYYGLSLNPDTHDLLIIMKFAKNGNLHQYLRKHFDEMTWEEKFETLQRIANGLARIHNNGLVHRDLHPGNILRSGSNTFIADLGLHPSTEWNVIGILPYVAPELLVGKPYSPSSDIYSLSMIMWEIASGEIPFGDKAHDGNLALQIYRGLRPDVSEDIPEKFAALIKRCWNIDPSQRPSAVECYDSLKDLADAQWKTSRNASVVSLPGRLSSSGLMTPTENGFFLLNHSANLSFSLPSANKRLRPYARYKHPSAVFKSRKLHFPDLIEKTKKEENKFENIKDYSNPQFGIKSFTLNALKPRPASRQFDLQSVPLSAASSPSKSDFAARQVEINPYSAQQEIAQQQKIANKQHEFTTFSSPSTTETETFSTWSSANTKYSRNMESPDIFKSYSQDLEQGVTRIEPLSFLTKNHNIRRMSNSPMPEFEVTSCSPVIKSIFGLEGDEQKNPFEENTEISRIVEIPKSLLSPKMNETKLEPDEHNVTADAFWKTTRNRRNSDSALECFSRRKSGSFFIPESSAPSEIIIGPVSRDEIRAFFANTARIQPPSEVGSTQDDIQESDFKKRPKFHHCSSSDTLSSEELDNMRRREMEIGPFISNLAEDHEEDDVLLARRRLFFGTCYICSLPNTDLRFCQDCRLRAELLLFETVYDFSDDESSDESTPKK
ncbi:hypothetical protein G9A89_001390 [Geosiphon pyriformis]|nr:hypothetical protein G9A89_001390 [Geosiphon pyriformis]